MDAMHLSRNYRAGRASLAVVGLAGPELAILHWTAGRGELAALRAFMEREGRLASYHYGLARDGAGGELVRPEDTAWHAGDGLRWTVGGPPELAEALAAAGARPAAGRLGRLVSANTASFGIALCNRGPMDADDGGQPGQYHRPGFGWAHFEPYPQVQVDALTRLVADLAVAHPSLRFVCDHSDITRTKGDPGPLLADWRPPAPLVRIRNMWDGERMAGGKRAPRWVLLPPLA